MRVDDLPIVGLQKIGLVAMQDAWQAAIQRRRMLTRLNSMPGGLNTDQAHGLVFKEGMEQANRVRATANTRHHGIR